MRRCKQEQTIVFWPDYHLFPRLNLVSHAIARQMMQMQIEIGRHFDSENQTNGSASLSRLKISVR
jgi:hypothetical protein